MPARLFATIVLLVSVSLCGCGTLLHRDKAKYETVVADPHHDEAAAIEKTREANRLMAKGHLGKAEQALRDAMLADVTYGPAHNNLGRLYYDQGKYYLAAWEFEYAANLMPERPEPHNNLGMVFEAVDRLEKAIAHYQVAYERSPQNPEFIGNLARARLTLDEEDEEARRLLSDLVLYDCRPRWTNWARERLALARPTETDTLFGGVSQATATDLPPTVEAIPPGKIVEREMLRQSPDIPPQATATDHNSSAEIVYPGPIVEPELSPEPLIESRKAP